MTSAAAFFDLDRTLLRRSSTLALAGPFRRRGLIGYRKLAKAAILQLAFVLRGSDDASVRRVADDAFAVLAGRPVRELEQVVAEAMEPVLKPLVYARPLELVQQHRGRGERVYIVSTVLQEIVDALADELGFDGALGSSCEVADGTFTGRALRLLHGREKAAGVRELAVRERIDLAASTAYADSRTDLPFLEAVGHPVAVNPDRRLRRIARTRRWPIVTFSEPLHPTRRPLRRAAPLALAVAAAWALRHVRPAPRRESPGWPGLHADERT